MRAEPKKRLHKRPGHHKVPFVLVCWKVIFALSCCGHFTQIFQQNETRMYKHREDNVFNLLEPDCLSLNFNSHGRGTNFSLFRWEEVYVCGLSGL